MRIDGTMGPEYLNLPSGEGKSSKSKIFGNPDSSSKGAKIDSGHEHVSAHKSLIQAALAAEEVNSKAVAEARQLLESGQLDTPEAAERAARNMLDLGC